METAYRYFICLSYKGNEHHGWQKQANSRSIQGDLCEALELILSKKIEIIGAGRTDTSVNARIFYAHFDWEKNLESRERENLVYRLNAILHKNIVVHSIFEVEKSLHARFSAISRAYCYRIYSYKNPFEKEFAFYYPQPLDMDKMNQAAKLLLDYQDFSCFSKAHTQVKTNICCLQKAYWIQEGDTYVFFIQADRFLRNMVRAIVGTLLDIGKGKYPVEHIHKVLASKNRAKAGVSVPGHGLYLVHVDYPEEALPKHDKPDVWKYI